MTDEHTNEIYIQHAEQFEAAFDAHARKWILLNPKPQKPQMSRLITWHHAVIALILIASAIVSASHTLPVALKGNEDFPPAIAFILAIATFIMIELTAIYFAYTHIVSTAELDEMPDISQPLKIGVITTVGAMFAINVYSVLNNSGLIPDTVQPIWSLVGIGIYLWVASIPPVNAYLSGDVLAIHVLELKRVNAVAIDEYNDALENWRNSLQRSWDTKKRDYGVSLKVSKPTTNQTDNTPRLSTSTSSQTDIRQTGAGYSRASTAVDNARQWLIDNPDKITLPLRELAELIPDAGKDSIGKARKQLQDEGLI